MVILPFTTSLTISVDDGLIWLQTAGFNITDKSGEKMETFICHRQRVAISVRGEYVCVCDTMKIPF